MVNVRQSNGAGKEDICIRADRWAYIVWLVLIGGVPFSISVLTVIFVGDYDSLRMLAFGVAVELFFFSYLRRQLIRLDASRLVVRKLFSTRIYLTSSLVSANFSFMKNGHVDRFGPLSRLTIRTLKGNVVLNAKLFRLTELRVLVERINSVRQG